MLDRPASPFAGLRALEAPGLRASVNAQPSTVPGDRLRLHAQFEEHAAASPDDVALVFRYSLADDDR